MEFGFFRGLPENLYFLDIAGQVAFLIDVILQFFIAYRDTQTYKMLSNRNLISVRYLKSHFLFDILACMPWDNIYRLYCTHTAACIFYYLATTLPAVEEGYTWIGSLKLGDYSYANFREIDLWKRYTTSFILQLLLWLQSVSYGEIHAVNLREMIFVMIDVSFDMVLGAYLIGNMTALIVKGSKTERYRDRMTDLLKYMNRNRLGRDIRNQIKGHLRLQYESNYTDSAILRDLPISIRAKISQTLYKSYIENVSLFKGCSLEFINQIVTKVHEEFFLPGEVIMEQGNAVEQLYFICHGELEEIGICEDGSEETFKATEVRMKQLETDITLHIGKHEAELALRVNSAAYYGDLYQLKSLIRAGADPNKKDYDGRTPLHLAASKGFEDIILFLIQEKVELNVLEAIKNGHDKVASLLVKEGATLKIDEAGSFLCATVARGDIDYPKRLLSNGIDPNSKDFDFRTPLHVAVSHGSYIIVKLLVEAGASVLSKERWGNTPLDEGRMSGNKMFDQITRRSKICSVVRTSRRFGVVVWIPRTIDELIKVSAEQLKLNVHPTCCIVTEDAGKILDVDMITDGQKLYLISE
ncbi:hypothetical protein L1987_18524 [Smallanthus sonchifolius]|uniref:Uncharacterized protein n=1 Tax=Smallanthus sonchifolius TaxID=185202 RepID=A0ACB9IZU2_9ASTR|nr:hypothetical protein L1987_18524 [Smallanthus sonchifolius]